jgi:Fe-S-cluster-containing dehydrogenase component
LLVESHEGRPTKVEGNPEHPATLGACDVFSQASVLQLYDPDRSRALTYRGEISSWDALLGALSEALSAQKAKNGAGFRILTETVTSPTLASQIRDIQKLYPGAKWHQWEPAGPHSARAAAIQAFGRPVYTYYNAANADVIVALDSDFLGSGPASLRYARQFAARRRVRGANTAMNRLYVAEPMPTPTGTKADHRLPMRAGDVEAFAWGLAGALNAAGVPKTGSREFDAWTGPIARDLAAHRGTSLVIAGECQPPTVHVLAHAMNAALGNVGKTVFYTESVEANQIDQVASLQDLVKDLDSGAVDLLLILGGNPVFTSPVEIGMRDRIQKAKLRIRLGLYDDETSEVCQWHLPETHPLETWSDARAFEGTVTILQPLINALYDGRSAHEVLATVLETPEQKPNEIVKSYWSRQHKGADFEAWWRLTLNNGVMADTALPHAAASLRDGALSTLQTAAPAVARPSGGALEVIFRPDPAVYDGRFANNGWLQEMPRPVTKLTWDNAAFLSPETARRVVVETGGMLRLTYRGRSLVAPAFVQPGHADRAVTLHLGYGRTRAGRTGTAIGFNPYGLRTADALWQDGGLDAQKAPGTYLFATTQYDYALDTRRHIIHKADLAEYIKNPASMHEGAEEPPRTLSLYPGWEYPGYAWGMAIDLNVCTGCSACVVACQAENNIAVVGKDQVRRGRHMNWLRVDTYYHGDPRNPAIYNQPVPCMQCENAPCELVCPVQATNHSSEGLNDMVYNRCVGTRYCSNNCPYKVRRFNFYLFSDYETPSLKLLRNPDVTVRSRGVMEKCTYCVQRINHAKITAEEQGRTVRDGDIQTACQAACPTEAIIFGNINDPESRASKMKAEKSNYLLLADLNTRPRTSYLGALRNPNPEMGA